MIRSTLAALAVPLLLCAVSRAEHNPAVERGRKALLETAFIPPAWTPQSYSNAWKTWEGVKEKPANYDDAFRKHYGVHEAPYPNNNLPMGLRKSSLIITGVSVDCMICHGGSIMGKSYVGLGNSSLDIDALFSDLAKADGRNVKLPFHFSNVRGTSEAGGMAVYLLGLRNPDLSLRTPRLDLDLRDDLCEDVPAWWILKKKKTMYYTGGADAASVRSKMQFMMTPIATRSEFDRHEAAFRDIDAFIKSIEAPKYPFPVDAGLAEKGRAVFSENCSQCHGTYGSASTYPNKVIPIAEIGTDRKRYEGISEKFGKYYNQSWFAQEKGGWFADGYQARETAGYQAPPLDGIWATAPYLHNGSVPNLNAVLNSKLRPKLYTRSFLTNEEDYDKANVGWKYTEPKELPKGLPSVEERRYYDTTKPGRGNGGHTYGDDLTEEQRRAVIEYLKTL